MAIAAYQNINEFPISIAGLTNELSVTVPTLKYIAGNYDSYVGVIPGFIKAADDYLTLPLQDVVYVAVPWLLHNPLPFANNAAAIAGNVSPGDFYYTDVAGERVIKVAYTP